MLLKDLSHNKIKTIVSDFYLKLDNNHLFVRTLIYVALFICSLDLVQGRRNGFGSDGAKFQ